MELLFIYGPAAVGKLTIGRELAKLTGYRLFHNHEYPKLPNSGLTIDTSKINPQEAARKIFEFFLLDKKVDVN
jgi:tRNA A37 N6-isopentenylltransferase MiaA